MSVNTPHVSSLRDKSLTAFNRLGWHCARAEVTRDALFLKVTGERKSKSALSGGPESGDRQRVFISYLADGYAKYPLKFTCGADTDEGRLEIVSGVYRWPGGNFVSGYDWRDGIGDPDKRPARYDYAWQTVEYNDVGIDEFMILCRLINIAPYICVNIGFGDSYSAAQWVEYCNGSVDTPMGGLRAAVACETSARIMSFS